MRETVKDDLRQGSLASNCASSNQVKKNQDSVLKCNVIGPFGSDDVETPFDANRASALLNSADSDLRKCWKRSNITKWRHIGEKGR